MPMTKSKLKRIKRNTKNRRIVSKLKGISHCLICGSKENLTFHHVYPATKQSDIATMTGKAVTNSKLKTEIRKCIIVCEDCHKNIHRKNIDNG